MKSSWLKYISGFYWVVFVAVCILFFAIQSIFYDPYSHKHYEVQVLSENAHAVLDDGTRVPIEIKHDCYDVEGAKANKVSRVEVDLPQITATNYTVSLLSNEQNIKIYIDGELRNSYDDTKYHVLFNNASSNVVSTSVFPEDSGKILRIEYLTTLSGSAKILGCARLGTELDFYCWLLSKTIGQVISAMLLSVLGILLIAIGGYLKILRKDDRGLGPLGLYSFLMGTWLFFRSNLRSFYLYHIGSAESVSYFILMLAPVPVLMFFNVLMRNKYQKIFANMVVISIINLALNGFLHVLGIINVIDYAWFTQLLIFAVCILCLVTILKYQRNNKLENGSFVVIGLIGFMLAMIGEDIGRIVFQAQFVGSYLGFGMLFFLFMIAYSAIKNLMLQEQEFQDALRQNGIKSAFLANMSHEIRTPINTILGMDEMILRENEDPNIHRYAHNIHSAGRTLLSLINDILDFSKIESGKMEILPKRYDLYKVLHDVMDATSMKAQEKDLQFTFHIDKNIPCMLFGDEIRIRQILTNILTNAVKYTKVGSVHLEVAYEKKSLDDIELIISVSDTGIGIKEEDQVKLFDSFVRLEENRNRSIEGTGLGMAITKQIVDMMNGSISLHSEYGRGTTFTVCLIQRVLDDIPIGDFSNFKSQEGHLHGRLVEQYDATDLRLLVVDDNEMNMEVIRGLLKNTGASIDTVDSGKACLEVLAKKRYDLIFLDHMMPEMDGIETLKRIKQMGERGNYAPVIALTANAIIGAKEEYLSYGFADYIAKPVDYKHLTEVIQHFVPHKFVKTEAKEGKKNDRIEFLESNGVNVQDALKYAGDDMEQYIHILEMFVSDRAKEKRRSFQKAYTTKMWKDYIVHVHSLKNAARTIGAEKLAQMAYEHEMHSKNGNITFVDENFEALSHEWLQVSSLIEQYLQGIKKYEKKNDKKLSVEISNEEWEKNKEDIIRAIDSFNRKEAIKLLEGVLSKKGVDRIKIQEVITDIQLYEYDRAIEHLKDI